MSATNGLEQEEKKPPAATHIRNPPLRQSLLVGAATHRYHFRVVELQERVEKIEEVFAQFLRENTQFRLAYREEITALRTSIVAMAESIAELSASNVRTDRILLAMQQQADKDRQAAEKARKDFNRRLAEVTDSQGLMIENMVWPNLARIAEEVFTSGKVLFQGIRIKRRLAEDRGRMMEIDLLAVGDSDVLVCEAKSQVSPDKVREFLSRLQAFRAFFPEHAPLRLRPMVASIAFDSSVVKFMSSKGVLALGFGGETMDLINPEALQTDPASMFQNLD